jgi:hypothetical protein
MKNSITITIIILLFISFIGSLLYIADLSKQLDEVSDTKEQLYIIKQVLSMEQKEIDIGDENGNIYNSYTECSNAYNEDSLSMVEYYCQKSRDESSIYSQKLRELKTEIPENDMEIFKIRRQMIEVEIEYLFALYESSEYLESAQRAYTAENWNMGSVNIDGQNERIEDHDNGIEDYSNLLAEYNKLKRELFTLHENDGVEK